MHMVVFTSVEGNPSYHQTDSLEEALKFVERVRNSEGVEDARLYKLTEIPLQVKTYVKVEIAGAARDGESRDSTEPAPSAAAGL